MQKQPREPWLLYGATGYSGAHIAEKAVAMGYRPALAGRRDDEGKALAGRLGLDWHCLDLNAAALATVVGKYSTVLHAAGPFVHTYRPMLEACLAAGTHYLDLTGEVEVFEALAALDGAARDAGIMLMPGVGFDMVPGDCLALYLKRLMPDAISLEIGISFEGTLSRGTILSALLALHSGTTLVRRAHRLVPLAEPRARSFDFGPGRCGGRADAYALTFGDLSVGWRTTGIPNITSYQRPVPEFAALANLKPADVAALPAGPSAEELATIPTILIGEVRNDAGDVRAARLVIPQIYAITFDLAATIAQRVHEGWQRCGYQTPASVFGETYITQFAGCSLQPWEPG
jgi:short subunit dehydrogenase-like uncharacterized protein